MSESENTQQKRVIGRPFQPGNPGKPKGAKHRLQEDFVKDVQAAWEEKGRDVTLNINDNSEMTDDELTRRIRDLAAQLSPFLLDGTGDTATGVDNAAGSEKSAIVH